MNGPCENTDRELWREREGDYYADSIHVTQEGAIGIDCGGTVYVKPVREWHKLAGGAVGLSNPPVQPTGVDDGTRYNINAADGTLTPVQPTEPVAWDGNPDTAADQAAEAAFNSESDELARLRRHKSYLVCYYYARDLANSLWRKHYQGTAPDWRALDNLLGLLTQIDNMVAPLVRAHPPVQPTEPI